MKNLKVGDYVECVNLIGRMFREGTKYKVVEIIDLLGEDMFAVISEYGNKEHFHMSTVTFKQVNRTILLGGE